MEDTYLETYNRRSLTNQPIQNSLVSVEPGVSYITLTKTLILFHCQPKKKKKNQPTEICNNNDNKKEQDRYKKKPDDRVACIWEPEY